METYNYHYTDRLASELILRQKKNENYSLRAYARDLGVHPSTMSLVLKQKRRLPVKSLESVIKSLALSDVEKTLFIESLYKTKAKLDSIPLSQEYLKQYIIDENYYHIISEWEHYALLSLVETSSFEFRESIISERLGLSIERVKEVITNLENSGLISIKGNKVNLEYGSLKTTEDVSSKALRASHQETLNMAKDKLEEVEVELRDFSSSTLAVNIEKLPEAKAIIREFRKKMASLLREGEKQEVYQLAIQLYPLTNIKQENGK